MRLFLGLRLALVAAQLGGAWCAKDAYGAATVENDVRDTQEADASPMEHDPNILGPEYDAVFPYYMKYCSTTKYHPYKGKGVEGTIAGHGIYYLKGACREPLLGPAGLKLCEESSNFNDPELGVGLSVNKSLKNANFLVTTGRKLFLGIGLVKNQTFNFAAKNAIIDELLAQGTFHGLEFHPDLRPGTLLDADQEEFIARAVFGTDYAVSLARNLYCINVPMNRKAMGRVVDYLNAVNSGHAHSQGSDYRGVVTSGTKQDNDYHWNVVFDNCVHPAWNALACVGMLKPKTVNRPLMQQIWNIPVPANTVLEIHKAANREDLDVDDYYKDPVKRQTFMELEWIPEQPGTLVEVIDFYSHNDIYQKDQSMFLLQNLFERRNHKFKQACTEPRYSYQGGGCQGLVANFHFFQEKYRQGLERTRQRQGSRRYLKAKGRSEGIAELAGEIAAISEQLGRSDLSAKERKAHEKKLAKLQETQAEKQEAKQYVDFVDHFADYLDKRIDSLGRNLWACGNGQPLFLHNP